LSQILASLVGLQFSREHESDADTYSVIYLCDTEYAANAAASFFEKLINQGTASPPVFLSTHPSPDDRIAEINAQAMERDCDVTFDSSLKAWQDFKSLLP
jgi:predicted Zn-dependent protease